MERDERGAAATEWVLLAPVVVLLVGAMVAGGRLAWARSQVADAAHAGARAASVQRHAVLADSRAREVAAANVEGVCGGVSVVVDVSGFRVPVGQAASVRTTVACDVGLGDLLVPGLPGSIRVSGTGVAVLDTYRSRG